jgi:2-succinyl-5-enolpyruvyl-6-hydroxy-3-cyclohexene-1-carboxylate synthase
VVSVSDPGDPAAALEANAPETPPDPDWLAAWRRADDDTADVIADALGDELSEPLVARCLGEWLPPDATVFVASSMPIRDVELFFAARELAPTASTAPSRPRSAPPPSATARSSC